jgi:hypothetical protein
VIFFVAKIRHFANQKKSQATWSRELNEKNSKKIPNFKEERNEIIIFLEDFG